MTTALPWTLYRDGKVVHHFKTEIAMWQWLHVQHSFSVAHAFQYEGYTATDGDGRPYGAGYLAHGTGADREVSK
jgi:hypothetical protein